MIYTDSVDDVYCVDYNGGVVTGIQLNIDLLIEVGVRVGVCGGGGWVFN